MTKSHLLQVIQLSRTVGEWFWNEDFWTPANYTWKDLHPDQIEGFPDYRQMLEYSFYFSTFMLAMKHLILFPLVFSPLTEKLGVPNRRHRKPESNEVLESMFWKYGVKPPQKTLSEFAIKLQWSKRKIQRWLRRRKASIQQTVYEKSVENFYILLYKFAFLVYGFYVFSDKEYVWELSKCWDDYPKQAVGADLRWYYVIGISYCVSQAVSLFGQPMRSETATILFHHLITVMLLGFSWVVNCVRIGALILLIHELSDTFLQVGKLGNYLKWTTVTDISFVLFLAVWCSSRVYYFPFYILNNIVFHLPPYIAVIPALYFFELLLLGILGLDIYWTYLIANMIYRKLTVGVVQDLRSSDEFDSNEDTEECSDKVS